MIKITDHLKTVILAPQLLPAQEWAESVAKAGCVHAPLLIETLRRTGDAVCPQCLEFFTPEEVPSWCNYLVCANCGKAAIVLKMERSQGEWVHYSFSWPGRGG